MLETQLILLKYSVFIHNLFMFSSIFFIMGTPYINNKSLDFFVLMILLSFFLFKRCILVDIYNYILDDLNIEELPIFARDNCLRHLFLNKKEDLTLLRLDILEKTFNNYTQPMVNQKIMYITTNCIITMILLSKYNLLKYSPMVFIFIFNIFGKN